MGSPNEVENFYTVDHCRCYCFFQDNQDFCHVSGFRYREKVRNEIEFYGVRSSSSTSIATRTSREESLKIRVQKTVLSDRFGFSKIADKKLKIGICLVVVVWWLVLLNSFLIFVYVM